MLEVGLMSLGDLLADPTTGAVVSESERHRSLVDQAVLAESYGFASVHLGEHHFSDYMLSAPPVVLAAIGERTSTLRLSTAVTLAGNLDPVRVAEDYATVDVLSGGRAELVLGRGNLFVHTYEGFGHEVETARARYDESVALLTRLLTEEHVTWEGAFRPPLRGHTTRPRPVDRLPVWIGAGSRESAELAADLGCWLMLPSVFGSAELFAPIVDIYRSRWEANGRDWADARVGACSHTNVGPTTEAARAAWEPYYRNYWAFVGSLLDGSGRWPTFDYPSLLAGPAICGGPGEVVDRIGRWGEILGLDRHLFMFDLGGMPHAEVEATIERFAADVLPQLRATSGRAGVAGERIAR
ncbi:MAG: LLM class flavin-dependent oxidoreductase [Actinomycetota bacterium]